MVYRILRSFFKVINKMFMVPVFRLGLGKFVGNPITGYIMVMKTIGNKTGKVRYAPANYAIFKGSVYCMAGFGKGTHWYKNMMATPNVEAIIPSGPIAGVAEDATDSEEALHVMRQVFINSGIVGLLAGVNPYTISDSDLREKTKHYPLIRIRPTGIGSGPADAGGWLWILMLVLTIIMLWVLLR